MLLDECLPRQLKSELPGHDVATVAELGWAGIKNGALLRLAQGSFEVFLTVDRRMPFQQNLQGVGMAIVILVTRNNKLPTLRLLLPEVRATIETLVPGDVVLVGAEPFRPKSD